MPRGLWTGLEKATGNLSRTGLGLLQIQNQREHQATLEANSAARLGMAKEAGEREAKKFTAEETERLEGEKPISVETFADQVEGGVDGPQFKMLYKTVTDNGFVDMSQGGLGTFRKKDREEMLKLIGEPNYAAKLSRVSIGWWRSQKAAIGEQLKAKPEDEKLLQQRQKINLGLNQALGRDKDLQTQMAAQKEGAGKAAQNWILADRTTVISEDAGRTYMVEGGQRVPMPPDAIKVPGGATLGEMNMNRAKLQAQQELSGGTTEATGISPEGAALEGTGPYARIMSAFEATAGGFGFDQIVGKKGLFPEMADAKQYLRNVKQLGKAALMNSSRGAIWEQEKIDKLFPDPDKTFTNPRIEARKFKNLIDVLGNEKRYNNHAILNAVTPKEIEKYRTSNNEIDRLFALISEPVSGGIVLTADDDALINKYLK